jgi:alpha,alpha-trehalase
MLGLKESGEVETIRNMIDNFAYLIETYGHIPNGNRTYYLSRSQPPFFALIVELLAGIDGEGVYKKYFQALRKEYAFWMRGADSVKNGEAVYSVVKLKNGDLLNRYWDDKDTPRPESYREDTETSEKYAAAKMATMRFADEVLRAAMEKKLKQEACRHLRAGATSGIDFSTRWFADGKSLHTIQTTDFIPPDLNALLYHLEMTLAKAYNATGAQGMSTSLQKKASQRATLINKYCWNAAENYYTDYHFPSAKPYSVITPAGMYPFALLGKTYLDDKMPAAAAQLRKHLAKPGGIVTTVNHSGEQWDAPNGWAPLQWMCIWALAKNGEQALAKDLAQRWVKLNVDVFSRTGKLMEKYNVEDTNLDAGGGEYPSQDGFGWTNGVLLALMKKYGIK